MAATIDTNLLYVRHDKDNVDAVPQPASTAGTTDPGTGWQTVTYINFNGDYDRHDVDNVDVANPLPNAGNYVKRDVDNNIVVKQPYQRHDKDNNPIT